MFVLKDVQMSQRGISFMEPPVKNNATEAK
jgi:hypothetical protein